MKRFSLLLSLALTIGIIGFSTSTSLAQFGANTILKPYQWQNRLILIFADSAENEDYQTQLESLESYPFELEDRQLEIISVFQDTTNAYSFTLDSEANKVEKETRLELESLETNNLRNYYQVTSDFTVLLIGKDGGVKRRSNEVLDAWEFFDQIDTMPMRQHEMSQ